jgi:hypothetical protein
MSSHHFVREGQEPALILGDAFSQDHIAPLLEWAPVVITLPPAINSVLGCKMKTDVVIASDSREEEITKRFEFQMPVRVLTSRPSDALAAAIDYIIQSGNHQANLWVADAEASFDAIRKYSDKISISIIDDKAKWSAIQSGKFRKWFPIHAAVRFHADAQLLVSNGIISQEKDEIRVVEDGILEISSDRLFWVCEAID